jgi:PEP-CTERM motif
MKLTHKCFLPALLAVLSALPINAATVSVVAPTTVTGPSFDVIVEAQNLFANRTPNDVVISYGFNVAVTNPAIFAFTGTTSGPFFDAATTEPGTGVFGAGVGQNGFGIEPGAPEPVTLATLHFEVLMPGSTNIVISSDLSNLFQGLQFLNAPFQESIAGSALVSATNSPEPATLLVCGLGLVGLALFRRRR